MSKENLDLQNVFQNAIKNLENFTFHNASSAVPHILNLEICNRTIISRPLSFFYYLIKLLFPFAFKDQKQKQAQIQEELLRSVIIIKKHSPLLDKFKHGSEEQQKLAKLAQNAVDNYNTLILQSRQFPDSLKGRFFKFLCDRLGAGISDQLKHNIIDLSTSVSSQTGSLSAKISSLGLPAPKNSLTQHELDAFCMKAITMIKNHDIEVSSIRETLNLVKTNPIQAQFDRAFGRDGKSDASIISLSQKVNVFPGEMIEFRGAFKRDSHSNVLSMPISESFQLSSLSIQDGFPHPSQYHGSALIDKLIPSTPLRLDQLTSMQSFYEKKKWLALELLPQGSLIQKAKAILKLKKQAFNENKTAFLSLHKELAYIFHPSDSVIDSFFKEAAQHENAYDFISQTYEKINELFITRPYEKLIEAWIDGLLHEGYSSALKVLQSQVAAICLENTTQNLFILRIGKVLAPAAHNLILQYQSEKMEFAPPPLNTFDRLIQAWIFKQALTFHSELTQDIPDNMPLYLQNLLQDDISLLKTSDFDLLDNPLTQIVHSFEDYFNSRFSHDLKLK